ncbi:HemK family protein methyltransferase [Candidatus Gracilibacteria bacterium]|nr:HemK family protein methyltransferase [Candidatus Gracilibacteria bacterium]
MTSNQPLPEEYIDGYVIFMGRRFTTDKRALIPRLETEELVKYCLKLLRENPDIQTVADIGTGSGIIPISIAEKMERPMQVLASDMSREALGLARENAQTKNTEIKFLQGDLLQPMISHFGNSVPEEILITANLPYVREKEINSGLIHEPRMAFLGGVQTGFELYERFFEQLLAWKNRPKKCHVVIEFGLWQRDIAETVFMGKNCSYTFFADLRGIERFAHICLSR